jgi:hypothetical protein
VGPTLWWREDGSVFCICCWSSLAQSFSGPSPLGLATIFYCLRFKTSHFVASYHSQGHGGVIRPPLNFTEAPFVFNITYLHGPHGEHSFYCWNVFIELLHSNGRGADPIENSLSCWGLFTEPLLSNTLAIHVTLIKKEYTQKARP